MFEYRDATDAELYGIVGGLSMLANAPKLQRRASNNRQRVKSDWLAVAAATRGFSPATDRAAPACGPTGCPA